MTTRSPGRDSAVLLGRPSLDDVVAVARHDAPVALSPDALEQMAASRAQVEALAASATPAYGISTGFGALANRHIPVDQRVQLQRSLIRSHAAGTGRAVEREVVRALMLLRLKTLASGRTGVRPLVAQTLADLLNAGITPVVHEFGSLGCSGDLAPLAHCALVLMGEGRATGPDGVERPVPELLAEAGIAPVELVEKEGLALINGTDGMLGMLALALADLDLLTDTADVVAAMSVEGLLGTDRVFEADLHVELRPHPGQATSAANMLRTLAGSGIVASHRAGDDRVQDAYSLRCAPQVTGAVRDTVDHARLVAQRELAAAIDNPVVLADGSVSSNGNFHGAPVGYVLDFLAIAVADQMVYNAVREATAEQRVSLQSRHGMRNPRLKRAVDLAQENIEEAVSPAWIAARVGLSTRQLERLFKRYLDTSPKRFIIEARLSRARNLLVQTEHSVHEIAVACGFATPSNFSKAFRAHFGVSPLTHRATLR